MPVIDTYYDATFNYGTSALNAFWGKYLGVRSEWNKKRLNMLLNDADPSKRRELIAGYQEQLTELTRLRSEMQNADADRQLEILKEYEETQRKNAELQNAVTVENIKARAQINKAEMQARQHYNAQAVIPADVEALIAAGPQSGMLQREEWKDVYANAMERLNRPGRQSSEVTKAAVTQKLINAALAANNDEGARELFKLFTGITPSRVVHDPTSEHVNVTPDMAQMLNNAGLITRENTGTRENPIYHYEIRSGDLEGAMRLYMRNNYGDISENEYARLRRVGGSAAGVPSLLPDTNDPTSVFGGKVDLDAIDRRISSVSNRINELYDQQEIAENQYERLLSTAGGVNLFLEPISQIMDPVYQPMARTGELRRVDSDAYDRAQRQIEANLAREEEGLLDRYRAERAAPTEEEEKPTGRFASLFSAITDPRGEAPVTSDIYEEDVFGSQDPIDVALRDALAKEGMDERLASAPEWASQSELNKVAEVRARLQSHYQQYCVRSYRNSR